LKTTRRNALFSTKNKIVVLCGTKTSEKPLNTLVSDSSLSKKFDSNIIVSNLNTLTETTTGCAPTVQLLIIISLLTPHVIIAGPPNISVSPDGKEAAFEWRCTNDFENDCNSRATGDGKSHTVWKHVPAPDIMRHCTDLAKIRIGCGAPCFYSKFSRPSQGLSEPIKFEMAVAPGKSMAASQISSLSNTGRRLG
jgi:hypothetical protein